MFAWSWKVSLLVSGVLVTTALAQSPVSDPNQAPSTTREHLNHEDWWPTKQFADQSQFAGTQACATCHAGIVRTQITTGMARTMTPASDSSVLASHLGEIFTYGNYHYSVAKAGRQFTLNINDGKEERTEQLQWVFGSGALAQSFDWWRDGQFYESRFNYFTEARRFDPTPGRLRGAPVSLDMAVGRKIAGFEVRKCFACHATALTTTEPASAANFHPGIECEACHGPGRDHVAAMKVSSSGDLKIVSAATQNPVKSVDFCGACHGTPKDVELLGMAGKVTVRFPAYRIEKSRCWGAAGDSRLTCFACHNPHRPLEKDAAAYDFACLRCHKNSAPGVAPTKATEAACPVAKSRCTSCHMPKSSVPGIHGEFTDHDIRIANANAPFPD